MMFAAIHWGAANWSLPVALIGVTFAALVAWSYRHAAAARSVRWLAGGLKMFAVGLLLLCLLEPLISGVRPRPGANVFALLLDNSRSMQMDNRGIPSAKELPEWLGASDTGWRARLGQDFDVRSYAFDRDIRRVDELADLAYDGDASNLSTALETLAERFRNRPLAGILLVSDGNVTDFLKTQQAATLPDCPLYAVADSLSPLPRDLRIRDVRVSQTFFETSPTTISGDLVATGFEGEEIVAQLVHERTGLVDEQRLTLQSDVRTTPIMFRVRPEESGLNFYKLQVFAASDRRSFQDRGEVREVTAENNFRSVLVKRGGGPFRVLYVAGRPNWEFKFLRRSLADDDEIQLVGLLRIARREAKFQFRDQSGTNDTNRLFQGFDDGAADEAEEYDQPVFVRIGVRDAQELVEGFPSTAAALFQYDAVVVDDLEAPFFSPDQMLLLRRYVSQRGGGLMMLGGVSSFVEGGYARTTIGDMLPVYLAEGQASTTEQRLRMRLTREGMLESWTRLRATEAEEKQRLERMPGFLTRNAVGNVKPGAMIVAELGEGDEAIPALATQRFGKGRTSALMVGDLWRWSMERQSSDDTDPELFWKQLMRWLVADVPQRVEVQIDDNVVGEAAKIQVRVRTEDFLADDNASVELAVESPGGESVSVTAEPSGSAAGTYVAEFWPRTVGGHRVTARVTDGSGEALRSADAGWVFAPNEREFEQLKVNQDRLSELTQHTGGRLIKPNDIADFVTHLKRQPVPVSEHWIAPLWHQTWVLTLALACLSAEWGLRRWKGLP